MSILFVLCVSPSWASFEFNAINTQVYNDLLKLKVHTASQQLDIATLHEAPTNGINIYLENYKDIIKILLNQDNALYEELAENEDARIKSLKDLDESSPYYLYTQADIKLHWTVVKANFGDLWKAFWGFRQAYRLTVKNQERFPDFLPNKKILGLCHIVIGSIPEEYTWVAELFGLKGDVNLGMEYLNEVIESDNYARLETLLIKKYLDALLFQKADEAFNDLYQLCHESPDNLLIHAVTAILAIRMGKCEKAVAILEAAPEGTAYQQFYFLDYLYGEAKLKTGSYYTAIRHFNLFLEHFHGKHYVKDAYFKLFLAHWFLGDEDTDNYLAQIRENGTTMISVDRYAERFANYKQLPHKEITKARILTDGGELEKAFSILEQLIEKDLNIKRDKVEYYYRKARIYHKQKKYKEALSFYKVTMEEGTGLPYYFAANSALQLGFIYRDEYDNVEEARFYFKKAISIKKNEYKNSIEQQAKNALKSL